MASKADALDRLVQVLIALVALVALGNGTAMLIDPYGWYQAVPTVRFTGPANPHFIRDIGLAYLLCGGMLGYAALNPRGRLLTAATGNLWLSAHGAFHVWEVLTGICSPDVFWRDVPAVIGPPAIVWIALAIQVSRKPLIDSHSLS
jgi:hypothetical protein